MRDINDPASPYASQYSDWDKWIYETAYEQAKTRKLGTSSSAMKWYSAEITAEGFVKPQLATLAEGLDRLSGALPTSTEHCNHMISLSGEMAAELEQRLQAESARIWAERYPRVPDWLASSPALRNMVLPSGEVITLGALGAAQSAERPKGAQAYSRYSAGGELLGQTLPGEMWQALFVPDWTSSVLLAQLKQQRLPRIERGCTVFYDRASNAVVTMYSFDGQALPADSAMSDREPVLLTELTAKQLVDVHAAQQTLLAQGG